MLGGDLDLETFRSRFERNFVVERNNNDADSGSDSENSDGGDHEQASQGR